MTTHDKIIHALTDYDRKQSTRKGYNRYALPQYFAALDRAETILSLDPDHDEFDVRKEMVEHFCGRVLDVVLKAIGQPLATDQERR